MAVALLALPLPFVTLHSCQGGEEAYSGLQWVFLGGPPLSLVSLGVVGGLSWWALRRQPEAPDLRVLGAAFAYVAATIATFLTFVMPAVAALFGHVEWRFGGWIHLGAWAVVTVLAAVAALEPLPAGGDERAPRLLLHSRVVRWAALCGVPLAFLGSVPFSLGPVVEGERNPWWEITGGLAVVFVVVVLPSFALLRALEARIRVGRPAGVLMLWIGLVLAWAGVALGVGGGVVNVMETRDAEAMAAEEAAAQAAEAAEEFPADDQTR